MNLDKLQVFTGNSNPKLTARVCARLELPVGDALVNRFPDGELNVKINETLQRDPATAKCAGSPAGVKWSQAPSSILDLIRLTR